MGRYNTLKLPGKVTIVRKEETGRERSEHRLDELPSRLDALRISPGSHADRRSKTDRPSKSAVVVSESGTERF